MGLLARTLPVEAAVSLESPEPRLGDAKGDGEDAPPSEGRPDKVAIRVADLGGWGKAAILMVRLTKRSPVGLPGFIFAVEVDLNVGMEGDETVCCGFGRPVARTLATTDGIIIFDGVRMARLVGD